MTTDRLSDPRDVLNTHNGFDLIPPYERGPWWFACDEPERPPNDWTIWLTPCDRCMVGLVAAVASGRTRGKWHVDGLGDEESLDLCLADARRWREAKGLRYI